MNNQQRPAAPQARPAAMGPMGRGPMVMGVQKARDFKGTMRKLIQYLSAYKLAIVVVIIFSIASTVFTVVGPKILGLATTKLFEGVIGQLTGSGAGIDFGYIGNIILLLTGLYLIASVFSYIQGWIMAGVSMQVTYRFRKDISEKINRMPLRYFDGTNHGEVLSRVTNDVDTVSQTLNQSLSQIITSLTSVIGVTIMMLSISWVMSLVAFVMIPVSFVIMGLVIRQSQKYYKEQQDYLGHVNGHVEEMYSGHLVVKAFNGEARSTEKFDKYNDTLFSTAWKSQFLSGLLFPVISYAVFCLKKKIPIIDSSRAIKITNETPRRPAYIQLLCHLAL